MAKLRTEDEATNKLIHDLTHEHVMSWVGGTTMRIGDGKWNLPPFWMCWECMETFDTEETDG